MEVKYKSTNMKNNFIKAAVITGLFSISSCSWGWHTWENQISPLRSTKRNVVTLPADVYWTNVSVSIDGDSIAPSLLQEKVKVSYVNHSESEIGYRLKHKSIQNAETSGIKGLTIERGKIDSNQQTLIFTGRLSDFVEFNSGFRALNGKKAKLQPALILEFESDLSDSELASITATQMWYSVGL